MRSTTLAAAACFFSLPALAGPPSMQQMKDVYNDLNDICRGGSGDHQETLDACDVRGKVDKLIGQMKTRLRRN